MVAKKTNRWDKIVVLKHMFDPTTFAEECANNPEAKSDLLEDVKEKLCNRCGRTCWHCLARTLEQADKTANISSSLWRSSSFEFLHLHQSFPTPASGMALVMTSTKSGAWAWVRCMGVRSTAMIAVEFVGGAWLRLSDKQIRQPT